MHNAVPYLPILAFVVVFAAFVLPGYGWATWLHRRDDPGRPLRWALGFAWSLTVFGLLGSPFLLCQRTFAEFLAVLYPAWVVYLLAAGALYAWTWRGPRPVPAVAPPTVPAALPRETRRRACLFVATFLALALALAGLWCWQLLVVAAGVTLAKLALALAGLWCWQPVPGRLVLLGGAPLFLVVGWLAVRRFRAAVGPLLRFTPEDDAPAPRLWTAAAAGLILLQAVSAAVYDRPDWDDCFYMAAVLDYQHGPYLNEQDPVYREGYPMPVIYRSLCWELAGATVCHLTGLTPLTLFRSLLPGPLVVLAYAAYAGLLREYLPRRYVPLALLGLSGAHLWGISSHETSLNFLLPRAWQAKTVLSHLVMPLVATLLTRYVNRPSRQAWLSLTACIVAGLVISASAIFMGVILVAGLSAALMLTVPARRVRILLGVGLAAAPLVVAGVALRLAIRQGYAEMGGQPAYVSTWLNALHFYTNYGCAELAWLLSLPLLAALLGDRRRQAYLVGFPLVLGLTFANPLLYHVVARNLTSYPTYFRLWWLLPIGPGLAALLALVARFLSRALDPAGGRSLVLTPLAVTGVGLLLMGLMPGLYVWSPRNSFIGPLGTPHPAQNLDKVPSDLRPLAELLARDPEISSTRILCDEQVATFLNGSYRQFRYVLPRPLYVGNTAEFLERWLLARLLIRGPLPAKFSDAEIAFFRSQFSPQAVTAVIKPTTGGRPQVEAGELLERYRVKYILSGPGDRPTNDFRRYGYRILRRQGDFVLWQRTEAGPHSGASDSPS
jgi:hypothetical protein